MTDTAIRAGGLPPTNQIPAETYNPLVGVTIDFPDGFPPGTPVVQSLDEDSTVIPGLADSSDTTYVVGITIEHAVPGSRVLTQTGGPLELTVAQWANITGQVNGLTRGIPYYLSATNPGKLTVTAPSGSGQFVAPVGVAHSATLLFVQLCCAELANQIGPG